MIRRSHILTTAALLAACVVPAAADARYIPLPASSTPPAADSYQDLRSPDARDAAGTTATQVTQDLRSPDARDAGRPEPTQVAQDLRSPDARDAGRESPPVQTPVVQIREVPSGGFDWGDAGIGAAVILALSSIAAGLALMLGGRRRRRGIEVPAH